MNKKMTARKYLGQAYRLDDRINNKLGQLAMLRTLATHVTSTLNEVSVQTSHNNSKMEDTILKIYEQEREIDDDIDRLVDLKAEISRVIGEVETIEYKVILEKRYLLFETWEAIAVDLGYSVDYIFKMHRNALDEVKVPE